MAELTKDVIDTIIAEAGGDGKAGMTAVAWAIANRAAKSGISPDAVVKQPKQFEGFSNPGSGSRQAQRNGNLRQQVEQIWNEVQNRAITDPLQGGTMFHASSVSPYWADEENRHGTVKIGGQTYYLGGSALPPAELPQVATLTDTQRPAPLPATLTPNLRAMRNAPATSLVGDSMSAVNGAVDPAVLVALTRSVTPRPLPSPSDRVRGQTPMPSLTVGGRRPIGLSQPGNLDLNARKVFNDGQGGYRTENSMSIGTDAGEVLIPTVVNGRQLSEQQAIQHYEQTGENLGTFRTPQAADRYAETLHERQAVKYQPAAQSLPQRPALPAMGTPDVNALYAGIFDPATTRPPAPASVPQSAIERGTAHVASPIGQPPTTRTVQSVPMPALRPQIPQSYAGQERSPLPPALPRVTVSTPQTVPQRMVGQDTGVPRQPFAVADFVPEARYTEPRNPPPPVRTAQATIPGPNGYTVDNKGQERLAPGVLNNGAPLIDAGMNYAAAGVPQLPRPPISRLSPVVPQAPYRAVASEMSVQPPALPIPRPVRASQLPSFTAPQATPSPVTPMPRLQRGGLFGKPQILGHDIPLPGIFGVIQNATKAMNNASGPFNNGADNLLYNTMRGGDFNTPGAATAQAGGYLYAPKPGGGWLNVGRAPVNPSTSSSSSSGDQFRPGRELSQLSGRGSFAD